VTPGRRESLLVANRVLIAPQLVFLAGDLGGSRDRRWKIATGMFVAVFSLRRDRNGTFKA